MDIFGINIESIVELGTSVATIGALAVDQFVDDRVFEHLVSVAVLVYNSHPGG